MDILGYDRTLTKDFFLNTLRALAPFARVYDHTTAFPENLDYVSTTLTDTALVGPYNPYCLNLPWYHGDVHFLAKKANITQEDFVLQEAELAANALLIWEGVIRRGGLSQKLPDDYTGIAIGLYSNAARRSGLEASHQLVLRRMSLYFEPWATLLGLLPDSEVFMSLLEKRPHNPVVTPGDAAP